MASFTKGILKSVWRVRLETTHGATTTARRIFDCNYATSVTSDVHSYVKGKGAKVDISNILGE
jgi:hypothetical protein